MSKKATAAAVAPSPAPPPAAEEAPPLVLVGLERTKAGFIVVSAVVKGDRVESRERHGPPQMKQWAAAELKRVLKARVLFPNGF